MRLSVPVGRRRSAVLAVAAAGLLLIAGWAGYRTFGPAEVIDPAQSSYPGPGAPARPVVYGALIGAPLVVDDRLRVYSSAHEVHADAPLDAGSSRSPYWAYRRWPAQLVGLAVVGTTVVSQWSDHKLVALDARTGRPAWRSSLTGGASRYQGRRTGAVTTYTPPDLLTAAGPGGEPVLIVMAGDQVRGYAAADGQILWQQPAGACPAGFTAPGVLALAQGCGPDAVLRGVAPLTGRPLGWAIPVTGGIIPQGCAVGRSACGGWRAGVTAWWLDPAGHPVPAPALTRPDAVLAGGVVIRIDADGRIAASSPAGSLLWTQDLPNGTKLLASTPDAVALLRPDWTVVLLAPTDGRLLSAVALPGGRFQPGACYAANRYLFIERLRPGAQPGDSDLGYYLGNPAVLVLGT